jgi:glycerophosphoryl diester phosphodiesterase
MYQAAPENTLASLVHGMDMFDAIEFDIRLTKDGQVVIHHDRSVSVDRSGFENRSPYVEDWELDELLELGFCSLEMLLEHKSIRRAVNEQGKVLVVESKRPSLKVKKSGGWFEKNKHDAHMGKTMQCAEQLLDQYDVPKQSTVHYAFHKSMKDATTVGDVQRSWSTLLPTIRPFGGRRTHRFLALPEYVLTPFSRLMRKHQKNGSPMMPCAIEYLQSPTNMVPLGKTVGLRGQQLKRLTMIREGFPVYVWPVKPSIEHAVLSAGLSALTDESDPRLTWLPSGHARWNQPATLPLDERQRQHLDNATQENHLQILKELQDEVVPWKECDKSRKRDLLSFWRTKWQWSRSVDELLGDEDRSGSMPWEVVRMIGHRGAGKTKRPVL